ncbi:type II toxin-antitoxin system RelE/ParE family toxin [Methanosarcina horonobensis]|uniref:type II toxin-antitoxin system RelE/ParE family toxin n=1 Tax=Methanosarcina horonobensis TaxID=418008 RepID=UPI001EF5615E|nr:type II toxin-antitoxin system RelE/ParE family toxin [Methanosarcina horonobensis]
MKKKQRSSSKRILFFIAVLRKTVNSILENPECGKPLRNVLKGLRRVHIGHFVLIYEIDNTNETITFFEV